MDCPNRYALKSTVKLSREVKDQCCLCVLVFVYMFALAVQALQKQRQAENQKQRKEEVWQQNPNPEVPIWQPQQEQERWKVRIYKKKINLESSSIICKLMYILVQLSYFRNTYWQIICIWPDTICAVNKGGRYVVFLFLINKNHLVDNILANGYDG